LTGLPTVPRTSGSSAAYVPNPNPTWAPPALRASSSRLSPRSTSSFSWNNRAHGGESFVAHPLPACNIKQAARRISVHELRCPAALSVRRQRELDHPREPRRNPRADSPHVLGL